MKNAQLPTKTINNENGLLLNVDVENGQKTGYFLDQKSNRVLLRNMSVSYTHLDKEDYLLAMERSPIKDVEIKVLLKNALTDKINDREVYMKGIDASYYYEGYNTCLLYTSRCV